MEVNHCLLDYILNRILFAPKQFLCIVYMRLYAQYGSLSHWFSFPGTQFKVTVEYAPSQRVPKQWSKQDGRDGTIYKGTT